MKFFDRIRAFFSETFGSSGNRRREPTRPTRENSYFDFDRRSYEARSSVNRSSQASYSRSSEPCFRQMPTATSTRTERSFMHSTHTIPQSSSSHGYAGTTTSTYKSRSTRDTISTPQYSLKNFTLKVESSPKDKTFTPLNNVMYHNEWTTCSALIVDQFGNALNTTDYRIEAITSNSPSSTEFRNAKLQNGRLQFSMKASNAGTMVTINIKIHKYSGISNFTLTEYIKVSYNPCSNILSEIRIKEIDDRPNDKCIFQVSIVDVWGYPAVWSSQGNCKLEAHVLQSENYVEIEKCSEGGHLCFDLSVTGERPWSVQGFVVFLNGKKISSAETKFEVPNEERGKLLKQRFEALEDEDYDSIPNFVIYDHSNSRVFIPASPNLDDGQFIPYDDEMLTMKVQPGTGNYHLVCKNATKHDIMGADFAHVNNIKRVLQQKDRLQIEETSSQTSIILDHCNVSSHLLPACKKVVLHLLRGLYYRKKASEAARVRMDWKKRIDDLDEILISSSRNSSPTLKFCKYFKDYYGNLMNRYNREACDELFSFFNFDRDESEVDLHGLLVANEEKLELLRLNLLAGNLSDDEIHNIIRECRLEGNKYSGGKLKSLKKDLLAGRLSPYDVQQFIESCHSQSRGVNERMLDILEQDLLRRCNRSNEVEQFIERCRTESDEAIRKLEETLENFNLENAAEKNSPWIEIIVGAGHHSKRKEKQNIRPKVEKFLKERGNTFTPVNKGSLVVTFVKYSGPQPCFGEYYCEQCDRCWKSSKSYAGKYQQCSRCRVNCWPVKQREKEKILNYCRDGMQEKRKSRPHQSELCQRCGELGYPCNEDDY